MDTSTIVWIIVAVVVVAAIIAFVVSRSGARKVEAQRAQAAEIREKALDHDRRLRENEASATEADAKAQMARAEAQKRELEAERLAAEADSRSEQAEAVRRERDEHLRLADLRDPDVRTDKDGNRLDQPGVREGQDVRDDGADRVYSRGSHDGQELRDNGTERLERRDGDRFADGSGGDSVDQRTQAYEERRTGSV